MSPSKIRAHMRSPPSLDRFRTLKLLGEGASGRVFLVEDVAASGRRLALKELSVEWGSGDRLAAFRREFLVMRQLQHTNLVRVYDFGLLDEESAYFTMELVEGVDAMTATEKASPADLESLLVQVCQGLAYLHGCDLLHLDIKPDNLLIAESPTGLHAKLADFGLTLLQGEYQGGQLRGTPTHMAPELFAGAQPDARTDLYSLGVTFYELATRRRPFTGDTVAELLAAHRNRRPPEPMSLRGDLSEALDAILMRLLAKKPSERYASATDVLQALSDLAGCDVSTEELTSLRTRHVLGRDEEIQRLLDLWGEVCDRGKPAVARLNGISGSGRSRLLEELKHQLQVAGVRVLETNGSHELVGSLAGVLGEGWNMLGPTASEAFAEDLALLRDQVDAGADLSKMPAACVRMLLEVAKTTPVAVLVDDVEELPSLAREILLILGRAVVLAGSDDERYRLLLVMTSDTQEEAGLALPDSDRVVEIEVAGLSSSAVEDCVRELLGGHANADPSLIERLCEETSSLPGRIEDALRGLIANGVLRRRAGGWNLEDLDESALDDLVTSDGIAKQRVADLVDDQLQVAQALALGRAAIDSTRLASVVGRPEWDVRAALQALARRQLVVEREGQWRPAGGPIRRALLADLRPDREREVHDAHALAIDDRQVGAPSLARVHHLLRGTDLEQGASSALEAAARLQAQNLVSEAGKLLADVVERAADVLPADRVQQARFDLASCMNTRGETGQALEEFLALRNSDATAALRVQAGLQASAILLGLARAAEALELLREVEELAIREPDDAGSVPAFVARCNQAIAELSLGHLTAARECQAKLEEESIWRREPKAADAYHSMRCWLQMRGNDPQAYLEAALDLVKVREEIGGFSPGAQIHLGNAYSSVGDTDHAYEIYHRNRVYAEERYRLAEMVPFLVNEAGQLVHFKHDAEAARPLLVRAAEVASIIGRWSSRVEALGRLASVESDSGRYGEAMRLLDEAVRVARERVPLKRESLLSRQARLFRLIGSEEKLHDVIAELVALVEEGQELPIGTRMLVAISDLHCGNAAAAAKAIAELLADPALPAAAALEHGLPLLAIEIALQREEWEEMATLIEEWRDRLRASQDREKLAQLWLLEAEMLLSGPSLQPLRARELARNALNEIEETSIVETRAHSLVLLARAATRLGDLPAGSRYYGRARALLEPAARSLPRGPVRDVYRTRQWREEALKYGSQRDGSGPAGAQVCGIGMKQAVQLGRDRGESLLARAVATTGASSGWLVSPTGGELDRLPVLAAVPDPSRPCPPLPHDSAVREALAAGDPVSWEDSQGTKLAALPLTIGRSAGRPVAILTDLPRSSAEPARLAGLRELLGGLWSARLLGDQLGRDESTGLWNRQAFQRLLRGSTPRDRVILMAGVRGLHAPGAVGLDPRTEEAMAMVAEQVSGCIGSEDLVARHGQIELAVCLDDGGLARAQEVAQLMNQRVSSHPFAGGMRLKLATGIAPWPADELEPRQPLQHAYAAMSQVSTDDGGTSLRWGPLFPGALPEIDVLSEVLVGDPVRDHTSVRLLLQTLEATQSDLPREEMLARIVDRVLELIGAERGILFLVDSGGNLEPEIIRQRDPAQPLEGTWSHRVPERVFREGEPVFWQNQMDSSIFSSGSVFDLELHTVMCSPLRGQDQLLGVLYLDGRAEGRGLRESDLPVFHALTREVARAIEVAELRRTAQENELIQRDLEIARTVALHLFPAGPPPMAGLDVACTSVSARELGGDYYDFFEHASGDGCTLAVGDVSGKGIGAALIVAMAKSALALLVEQGTRPREAMEQLSRQIARFSSSDVFMTMTIAEWHPSTGWLHLIGGGHEPALVVRADGTIEEHRTPGIVLGIGMGTERLLGEHDLFLEPGDVALLFSDGAIDIRGSDGVAFGRERLEEALVAACKYRPAAAVLQSLFTRLELFRGSTPLFDDLTLVVLHRPRT